MNVIVIGGVAAGTKTAAKLMRQDRSAKVTVYTKGKDISYAGCGLPYYVGGSIENREELIVNTPEKYAGLTGVEVRTQMEAVGLNAQAKTVSFENGETVSYDKLVIATGAVPFVPERTFPVYLPCVHLMTLLTFGHMQKAIIAAALWWWEADSSGLRLRKICWRKD